MPAADPAPATLEPASGVGGREHGGLSGLIAWLLVAIAALGLFASTPPSGGPDEQAHEVTAWYVSEHLLPPGPAETFPAPASLWVTPCFAGRPDVTALCMPARSTLQGMVIASSIVNYPPPYYLVVGIGQRIAALGGNQYADLGGRVASVTLNLGVLLLVSLYMRRRNRLWGNFLVLVSTPMSVFLGVVVNPSGWEITCGVAMAAALAEAAWGRRPLTAEAWTRGSAAILALATLGLATARPLGFVWAAGLSVSAIALAPAPMRRRVLARVVGAVAPGILVGALWAFTHPASLPVLSTVPASPTTIPNLANWFAESVLSFPGLLLHMFGVLGWLDTPMPQLLFLVTVAAWAVLLTRLASIELAAKICGLVGIVILPGAIEAMGWGSWPGWWQGRYTLPFALGFVLLLLLRTGWRAPRMVSIVSGLSVLSLGLMVWVNALRYGYGLDAYSLPASHGLPGISPSRLWLSAALGLVLVGTSVYLLLRSWRDRPDDLPGLEPGLEPGATMTPLGSDAA